MVPTICEALRGVGLCAEGFGIPWRWQAGGLAHPRTWETSEGSITFSRHSRTLNTLTMPAWSNGGVKHSTPSFWTLTTLIEHSLVVANIAGGSLITG